MAQGGKKKDKLPISPSERPRWPLPSLMRPGLGEGSCGQRGSVEPRALEGYLGLTVFQTLCPLATHLALGGCLPLPPLGENLGERAHVELYQVLWELSGGADSWALSLGPSVGRYLCLPVPHPAWPWLARVGAGWWTALPGGMWMTPERLSSLIWGVFAGWGRGGTGPEAVPGPG